MQYQVYTGSPARKRGDCMVVGAFENGALGEVAQGVDAALSGSIRALLKRGDFSGRSGESLLLPAGGARGRGLLLTGLGPAASYSRRAWRKALTAAISALARTRVASAVLALDRPPAAELDHEHHARAVAELTGATLYRINDRKTSRRPPTAALKRLSIGPYPAAASGAAKRALADGQALAESAALSRDLANLAGNICTPTYLANAASRLARGQRRLRVKVLNEAAIRRQKMGCFLSVTRGSDEPPRFIVMDYRGGKRGAAPLVLVGKGITFDTGGISLKDPGAMDEMKFDMCGAATVIAALQLVNALQLPINVVGLVPTCENMPSGRASKPGDIFTSASGQTVEVLNTDAEGRLILCDALHYARRYKPATVIDIATLTGACVIALGHHHSGIISNDDQLAQELVAAGVSADDRAWQLPLTDEYGEQLRSNFADMANVGGRDGGAITAGAFLAKFTRGLRWAHIDIAGTAWLTGSAKASTARPLSLLADFLIRLARG
jgi:leucyl aminopeptidase